MSPSKKLFLVRALPIVLLVVTIFFTSIASTGLAADLPSGPQKLENQLKFPSKGGYPRSGPIENVVDLISVLVWAFPSVMGAAALLMVVVAGFLMVSAMGNEEKIERAKMHLFYIAVGMGLLGFAYMIIKFVIVGITRPLK